MVQRKAPRFGGLIAPTCAAASLRALQGARVYPNPAPGALVSRELANLLTLIHSVSEQFRRDSPSTLLQST
jgi:hypothetical protein